MGELHHRYQMRNSPPLQAPLPPPTYSVPKAWYTLLIATLVGELNIQYNCQLKVKSTCGNYNKISEIIGSVHNEVLEERPNFHRMQNNCPHSTEAILFTLQKTAYSC